MRILMRQEYVKKFYDRIGHKIYQPFMKIIGYQDVLPSVMKELSRMVELKDGYNILDVGIGPGRTTIALLRERNVKVIGIDISKKHLKLAQRNLKKENLKDNVEFITADANNLPFRDNYFDFVVSTGMIEHLGIIGHLVRVKFVIQEMVRVLKTDRRMLLVTARDSLWGRLFAFLWQAGYYSEEDVLNMMRNSKLKSVEPITLDVKGLRIPIETGIVIVGSKVSGLRPKETACLRG